MSSSFDELEEDEQDELEAKEKCREVACATHHATRPEVGSAGHGPSGFLPSLSKLTTSRFCHWMSSSWASRGANFSSIDVRQCLPPMYHNTKNIVKTIKVSGVVCGRMVPLS